MAWANQLLHNHSVKAIYEGTNQCEPSQPSQKHISIHHDTEQKGLDKLRKTVGW